MLHFTEGLSSEPIILTNLLHVTPYFFNSLGPCSVRQSLDRGPGRDREVVGRKEENKELGTNDLKFKKICQHFTRLNLVSTNNTNLAPSLSHIL